MHGAPCPSWSASDDDGMPQHTCSSCSWRRVPAQGGPARPQHGCPRPCLVSRCARSGRLGGVPPRGSGAERPPSRVGGVCLPQRSLCSSPLPVFHQFLSVCHGGCQAPHAAWMVTLSCLCGSHTFPSVPGLPFPSDGGFFGFREVLKLNVAHPISAACPVGSVLRSDAFSLPWCPLSLLCLASAWFSCLHQDCL